MCKTLSSSKPVISELPKLDASVSFTAMTGRFIKAEKLTTGICKLQFGLKTLARILEYFLKRSLEVMKFSGYHSSCAVIRIEKH